MRFVRNMVLAIGFAAMFAACGSAPPAEKTTPEAPKSADPCATTKSGDPCATKGEDPCSGDVDKASPSLRGTDPCGGNPCNDK